MADVLPIHAYRQEIIDQISSNRVTILSAETGAGKSTTVPLLALESALSTHADRSPRILVSQPRRIAAKQLTSRVREQVHANAAAAATARLGAFRFQRPRLNWSEVKVGYRIMNERDDEGPKTHIVYSTVGYMVRRLAGRSDELAGVTHIIVDEAHERSVDTDLLCLLIRRKMADPSLDFKVVVMSATLETDLYMDYFIEKNPPARTLLSRRAVQADERRVINVGARRFPVHRIYFESFMDHPDIRDIFRQQEKARRTREDENNVRLSTANELRSYFQLQLDKFQSAVEGKGAGATNLKPSLQSHDYVLAAKLAFNLAGLFSPDPLPDPDNVDADIGHSVLVFLPGEGEIMTWLDYAEQLIRTLQADRRSRVAVYTLFAQGPRADMEEAFVNSKPGHLKIILATNIAESSVTIPDVTAIIDHGLRRSMEYNSNVGCQMLKLGWVSRASALQREGRAGRCREGFYYAMYTKSFHDVCLAAHDEPEIRALSLEQTILRVKQLFPQELLQHVLDDLMEPPDHRQVDQAIANLQDIGGFTRSPLPKDEDLGPTDAYEVTFFGTIIPDFPGEVSHTRLMIVGLGMDIPTDAVVLAAAMSAADPFLQPTRKYQSDRAELQLQHAVAFAGRLHFDQGLHSEVLTLYNVFKEWVLTPKKERHQFLVESGLQHARFKQFRQTIALAGPEANEELAKVRFDKLKVLADIARERWPPQEEEILEIEDNSERELKDAVEDILAATVEELRTVVLISCSANIAQGLPGPQNAAMVPAAQALESQDLVLPNAAPKAKDTKREADRLNKLLVLQRAIASPTQMMLGSICSATFARNLFPT
ncbi:P-loop containing nucleoside triphosphate hydrolase protein [Zopfochytrium polystomum]|nr:P-loop containing nucleoside triphosphate hydrolase protein [Zopfochytrium polystomum]